jgi:hypothetical protein
MALVKKLKSSTKTVQNSFAFNEPILIDMHNISGNFLEPNSKQFGNQLRGGVLKRDRPEVMNSFIIK